MDFLKGIHCVYIHKESHANERNLDMNFEPNYSFWLVQRERLSWDVDVAQLPIVLDPALLDYHKGISS
jgi:hypothetical protein